MATRVFISYRRDDSAAYARLVRDRLVPQFGREALFMDVDTVRAGMNFVKIIREEVAKCDVLLAVIGPKWLEAPDEEGNRRLDDQNDYVRIEIATALQRDIPVIPILLDGTRMPRAGRLPEDLKELEQRSGLEIRHTSFDSDIDRLIRELKRPPEQAGAAKEADVASRTPSDEAKANVFSMKKRRIRPQVYEGPGVRPESKISRINRLVGLTIASVLLGISVICFVLAIVTPPNGVIFVVGALIFFLIGLGFLAATISQAT